MPNQPELPPVLKPINFRDSTCLGIALLNHCWSCNFGYVQTKEALEQVGFRLPHSQWNHFTAVLNIQMQLDFEQRVERESRLLGGVVRPI